MLHLAMNLILYTLIHISDTLFGARWVLARFLQLYKFRDRCHSVCEAK